MTSIFGGSSDRPASQPLAGAGRVAADVGLASLITAALLALVAKLGIGDVIPNLEQGIFVAITSGLAFLGKVLRDRGWRIFF